MPIGLTTFFASSIALWRKIPTMTFLSRVRGPKVITSRVPFCWKHQTVFRRAIRRSKLKLRGVELSVSSAEKSG